MHIPDELRKRIIAQAKDRCEYCGLAQIGQEATFHVDHIPPTTRLLNLNTNMEGSRMGAEE